MFLIFKLIILIFISNSRYLITLVDAEGAEANVLFTENGEIIE